MTKDIKALSSTRVRLARACSCSVFPSTGSPSKISLKNVWKVSMGVGIDSNLKIATTCHKMRKQIMAAVLYIARVILSSNLILSSLYMLHRFFGDILLYLFYLNAQVILLCCHPQENILNCSRTRYCNILLV